MTEELAPLKPLIPLRQFAALCGTAHSTIRRAIDRGSLKAVRISGKLMFTEAEARRVQAEGIETPLAAQQRRSASQLRRRRREQRARA